MDTLYSTTMTVELVQGMSKNGSVYQAVRVGDSLIFDRRLLTTLLLKYTYYLEKEANNTK